MKLIKFFKKINLLTLYPLKSRDLEIHRNLYTVKSVRLTNCFLQYINFYELWSDRD